MADAPFAAAGVAEQACGGEEEPAPAPHPHARVIAVDAAKNGFDWIIAVAPTAVGAFLSKNYDVELLNPPLQPMMIIDKQGGVWGMPFGIKSAESLKKTIDPYLGK